MDYKKGSDLKSAVSINDCKLEHRKIINSFLEYLNNSSDSYILKGGAALFICYKSDRFSENIKLDSNKSNIKNIVDAYCKNNNYSYYTSKETDSIKKYMINYGNYNNPLEIELSLRNREINNSEVSTIDGIKVYNINTLCIMKAIAYVYREKIRDLYDLTFIVNNYFENLDQQTINIVQKNIEYNGIERLDYLIQSQKDEIINKKKLVVDFVAMSDKLGLLYSNKEREIINSYNIIFGK